VKRVDPKQGKNENFLLYLAWRFLPCVDQAVLNREELVGIFSS